MISAKENYYVYAKSTFQAVKLAGITMEEKYKAYTEHADFISVLSYLKTEDGGRKTPATSGYRPQVKFEFDKMQTSGQQTFIDKKTVYPGDTVEAAIKILSTAHFHGRLKEGMAFEFREGPKLIGHGVIKYILNDKLKQGYK